MDDYSDILLAVSPPYTDRDEPHTEYRSSRAVHYTAPSDTHTLYSDYAPDEEKGEQEEDSFDGLQVEKQQISSQHPAVLASPYSAYEGGFGAPPPTAQIRRNKTNRRVKLTQGNLILDCLIPTRLAGFLPRTEDEEFKYSRYTAVTCGPEDFEANRFGLRPVMLNRETELMVVITLYNENEVLFCRTLHGVMKNIAHLVTRKKSKTWGADGWKKVVVCIVADGRKAIHPRILDCLSALGVYQEGIAKNMVDNKPVVSHLYEYTTQLSIDPQLTFKGLEKGIVPCQLMFCLKEKNAKKLNSHRWALEAFAPTLQPNIVILIDVGTKPGPKSLYHLWKTFDLNSNVAGACGEITAMKGKWGMNLLNPLVAAQNFEYKMSNILDKPTESIFGYISVLPGAFSAYRYIALKNDALGMGPLASYFKGETLAGYEADVFTSNMYLAEDRILCWELVAKAQAGWVLKFVNNAQGETDVPDTIVEFISQRRRWLNGSFFASVYSLTHTLQLFKTDHSTGKKVALLSEAIYNSLNLLFAWFGLGNYYIFMMVLTSSLEAPEFALKGIDVANTIVQYTYIGTVVGCFLISLGNRPQGSKWKYLLAIVLFAITTAYMYGAAIFCIIAAVRNSESIIFAQIVISLIATYGTYVVSSLLALDPWHLVTSMPQYMLMAPVYINLLNIFAFSNLHDFSWGTKEQTESEVDLGVAAMAGTDEVEIVLPTGQADVDGAYDDALHKLKTLPMIIPASKTSSQRQAAVQDYYRNVRTNVLLAWALSNALLVATILNGDYTNTFSAGGNGRTQIYMVVILVFVALMSLVRFVGSTTYLVLRLFDR